MSPCSSASCSEFLSLDWNSYARKCGAYLLRSLMHVLPSACTSVPLSSCAASRESCAGVGAQRTDRNRAGRPALVVVQCSIPPNSRTVHGSRTSSWKSWLLAALLACCSLPMLPWLVSDSSAVESWFESLLTGAIVRSGCVTIPIANTQYRSETASAPAVSV